MADDGGGTGTCLSELCEELYLWRCAAGFDGRDK
jgi:hypothetical protein